MSFEDLKNAWEQSQAFGPSLAEHLSAQRRAENRRRVREEATQMIRDRGIEPGVTEVLIFGEWRLVTSIEGGMLRVKGLGGTLHPNQVRVKKKRG